MQHLQLVQYVQFGALKCSAVMVLVVRYRYSMTLRHLRQCRINHAYPACLVLWKEQSAERQV